MQVAGSSPVFSTELTKMERPEIIKKYAEMFDENLDEGHLSTLVLSYYMLRIKELGLIEGGGHVMTAKGFDVVNDVIEDGWKLTDTEIATIMYNLGMSDEETLEPMTVFVSKLQELGYDKMKEMLEEYKNEQGIA